MGYVFVPLADPMIAFQHLLEVLSVLRALLLAGGTDASCLNSCLELQSPPWSMWPHMSHCFMSHSLSVQPTCVVIL